MVAGPLERRWTPFRVHGKRVFDLKLYAISDLHLDYKINREALIDIPDYSGDWLITGGDLCTSESHLRDCLEVLTQKFAKVFWVPGNHELWSSRAVEGGRELIHGEDKYWQLVDACRDYGVLTPEDPYAVWPGPEKCLIVPLFLLYDYGFRPKDVPQDEAVAWAMESGVLCSDEKLINPKPYDSLAAWCRARLDYTRNRLETLPAEYQWVVVNHFPLREDLIRLRRIPRFSIWCGTRETESWHERYPVKVVVSGHLHMRATDYRAGVRFEEVSLGYPRDWDQSKGMAHYFREILPGPARVPSGDEGPTWRFF